MSPALDDYCGCSEPGCTTCGVPTDAELVALLLAEARAERAKYAAFVSPEISQSRANAYDEALEALNAAVQERLDVEFRQEYRAKVVAVHQPIDRGDGPVCSADGQPFPCEPLRSFNAEDGTR